MSRHKGSLAVLIGFVLLAAACGNSGTDAGDVDESTTTTTTTTTTEAPGAVDVEDPPDTAAPDTEPADQRNEFVVIEGVPGVSDDTIGVAVIGIRELNPLNTCILDCYLTGIQAYFDYINDSGGIYGRNLEIAEALDDELFFNQDRALEVIANNESFAAFSATLGASGWGDLNDARIPTFVWNIHASESANRDAIFGHLGALCARCTTRTVPYLASLSGATRVASIGYSDEASQACALSLVDTIDLYSDDLGLENAYYNGELTFGLPGQVGPAVTQMIAADVDFIAGCLDLGGMLSFAEELERQGVRDQITMYHPNSYDTGFVAEAGSLFDGDYVVPQFAAFEYDTGSPLRALYDEWVTAHGGPISEQTMVGWLNADQFVEGLLVASPDFDREKVIGGLNQTSYTGAGLINPIDWTRQHTPPTQGDPTFDYELECMSAVQMQDGTFVGFQPAPFMCWRNDDLAWSDPVPTNFAE